MSYYDQLWDNHRHKQIIDWINPNSIVLDFGCGNGQLSNYLMKYKDCQIVGIEKESELAKIARNHGFKVICSDIEDPKLLNFIPSFNYDSIIFADVLEHLVSPWMILNKCHRLLKPGGHLIISIPNIVHFSMRLRFLIGRFEYSDHGGIRDIGHLRFFTYYSVKRMFAETGYFIEDEFYRWRFMNHDQWLPFQQILRILTELFPNLLAYQMLYKLKHS